MDPRRVSQQSAPAQPEIPGLNEAERKKAAELIQKTYRGHRTRRELNGHGLDPTTKWLEAVRDAKYQKTTTPRAPGDRAAGAASPAREKWRHVTEIARRAGADNPSSDSDVLLSEASDSEPSRKQSRSKAEQHEREQRKAVAREKRKRTAKMMDLQYFLEMVDQKHRYGSSLRKYHAYWKEQDTDQNFFYWLDCGDGKTVELEACSRERLDKEQVRYLSREERGNYLVKIDAAGRLVWAKNGEHVWTKDELYRDSVKGIVPTHDSAPEWKYNVRTDNHDDASSESDSSGSGESQEAQDSGSEGERDMNKDFHRARGLAKLKHVSPAMFSNHTIKQTTKKGHKWIFVADTSFRLYIGYKQSGAFQHSSFLHGSRILAAGQIKVKDGQLRKLSPLSGHYRPQAANFRAFVQSLEDENADMSHVSISQSYAILGGVGSYVKTRKKIKSAQKFVEHRVDKLVRPEKVKAEEEAALDKSQSAQKEREYLKDQRLTASEHQNVDKKPGQNLSNRMSHVWSRITGKTVSSDNQSTNGERGTPSTKPGDGVPATDGN